MKIKLLALVMAVLMTFALIQTAKADKEIQPTEEKAYKKYEYKIKNIEEYRMLIGDEDDLNSLYVPIPKKVLDLNTGKMVEKTLEEGETVIVFLRNDTPMLMSKPPVTTPQLIAVNPHTTFQVDMDYYDKNGVGLSNRLVLADFSHTRVFNYDGELIYDENLKERELIALYKISTRSLPPQTNPEIVFLVSKFEYVEDLSRYWEGIEPNHEGLYKIREVLEKMGAEVKWVREGNYALVKFEDKEAKLYFADKKAVLGDDTLELTTLHVVKGISYLTKEKIQKIIDYLD